MPLPGEQGLRIGKQTCARRPARFHGGLKPGGAGWGLTGRSKGWLSKVENGHGPGWERRQDNRRHRRKRWKVSADSLPR